MDRRVFLKRAAATATAAIPFTAFVSRVDASGSNRRPRPSATYGPLAPVRDETTGLPLLMLPAGFSYVSFGWTGDLMSNGTPTPGSHDGMAAFPSRGRHRGWDHDGRDRGDDGHGGGDGDRDEGDDRRGNGHLVRIVRNHERGRGTPFSSAAYDLAAAGGTTTLVFDSRRGELVEAWDSVSGTLRNCAGGPTPWDSWMTCEETTEFTTVPHGYVFDVPSEGLGDPRPILDMGRFSHEALAIDPLTGNIYETEDAGGSSGFYRYVPRKRNRPEDGGRLYMLKVVGVNLANLGAGYANGTTFDVEWVRIENPDSQASTMPGNFVWAQGRAQGAATFARLEGCWYGNDRKIYVVSTSGGAVGQGQIWVYDPRHQTISLLFESPGAAVLNAPDNITVSPRGGLVLCEDGSGEEFMHGLTVDGEIFQFAKNNVVLAGERNNITGDFRGSEFAGACYSPDGKWLFANIQSPGITFAITGPWHTGAL
jgi:secreted PhoX family phosphatase